MIHPPSSSSLSLSQTSTQSLFLYPCSQPHKVETKLLTCPHFLSPRLSHLLRYISGFHHIDLDLSNLVFNRFGSLCCRISDVCTWFWLCSLIDTNSSCRSVDSFAFFIHICSAQGSTTRPDPTRPQPIQSEQHSVETWPVVQSVSGYLIHHPTKVWSGQTRPNPTHEQPYCPGWWILI